MNLNGSFIALLLKILFADSQRDQSVPHQTYSKEFVKYIQICIQDDDELLAESHLSSFISM
jgi:hypothetical protein